MLKNPRRGLESKHAFSISTNGSGRYGEKRAIYVWLGRRCEEANNVRIFSEPTHCPTLQGVEKNILSRGKHIFLQLANKKNLPPSHCWPKYLILKILSTSISTRGRLMRNLPSHGNLSQVDHQNGDGGWRNARYPRSLTQRKGFYFPQFFPHLGR
jgi:hypothetical protein